MMDVRSTAGGDDDIHGGMPDGAGGHGRDVSTQHPHRSQHQGEKEQEREKKETGEETKKERRKGC